MPKKTHNTDMQNYKNRLQEQFQKIGLGLPKYEARQTDSGWISEVELCNGSKFTGNALPTKIASDQDAARQALKYYEGHLAEFRTDGLLEDVLSHVAPENACRIWIVIDLENVGSEKEMMKLKQLQEHGFIVSGYASSNYRNGDKIKKYLRESSLQFDVSDLPEVADMRIMIDVTRAMIEDSFTQVFIISYDRFARAAAEVFNNGGYGFESKVVHCRTVDQVLVTLKKA